jgi:pantothenate kinase type III
VVIATGGLAGLVVPHCTTVERIERDLTLQGLRIAARHLGLVW